MLDMSSWFVFPLQRHAIMEDGRRGTRRKRGPNKSLTYDFIAKVCGCVQFVIFHDKSTFARSSLLRPSQSQPVTTKCY